MASTINADNGVASGITGVRVTADNSGNLALQANGNTVVTLDTSKNATFASNVSAGNVSVTGVVKFNDGTSQSSAAVGGGGPGSLQSIQAANFTATANNVYAINTTSTAVTVTLPASPANGSYFTFVDYAGTFATNNFIIYPNGQKIRGTTGNSTISTSGASITMIYTDATQGWLQVGGVLNPFIGTYQVSYLAVAGGGGSGELGGGGGGGGMLTGTTNLTPGTAYTITVGSGGSGGQTNMTQGGNSTISTTGINAIGGGYGAYYAIAGGNGGSGGGGSRSVGTAGSGTAGQGNNGGYGSTSVESATGGGGGAGAAGQAFTGSAAGNGGIGLQSSISGAATYYAGGGGGGGNGTYTRGTGGSGGGANGLSQNGGTASSGTANTGGGGGGGAAAGGSGGSGGSGIVIISYVGAQRGSGGTVTSSGGYTIHTFTTSGTYTA